MFLLSSFHILSWGRSWPLFIILAGLLTFFERTALSSAAPAYPVPPYPAPPAPSSTSIVPSSTPEPTPNQNNQEGR
jgi:hypothetical protein